MDFHTNQTYYGFMTVFKAFKVVLTAPVEKNEVRKTSRRRNLEVFIESFKRGLNPPRIAYS